MKTKGGVKDCDDAIRTLRSARAVPALRLARKLCDACKSSYRPKASYEPVDALEAARKAGRMRGASRQILYRGKFSNPVSVDSGFYCANARVISPRAAKVDALDALLVDDGNQERTRRKMLLDSQFAHVGMAFGKDGNDYWLLVVLCEKYSDETE